MRADDIQCSLTLDGIRIDGQHARCAYIHTLTDGAGTSGANADGLALKRLLLEGICWDSRPCAVRLVVARLFPSSTCISVNIESNGLLQVGSGPLLTMSFSNPQLGFTAWAAWVCPRTSLGSSVPVCWPSKTLPGTGVLLGARFCFWGSACRPLAVKHGRLSRCLCLNSATWGAELGGWDCEGDTDGPLSSRFVGGCMVACFFGAASVLRLARNSAVLGNSAMGNSCGLAS